MLRSKLTASGRLQCSSFRLARFKKPFLTSLLQAAALVVVLAGAPGFAIAAVDLVVNNDDTGYDPTPAGGTVRYQVTVTNNALTDTATGVQTTHSVSANATFLGYSGTGVTCSGMAVNQVGPGTLTCTLPNLTPNAKTAITFDLRSSTAGIITLGASATSSETDSQTGNNTLNESTTINAGADLAIDVSPASQTVSSGSTVSLSLQVTNNGPDSATDIVVTTPIPVGLSVTSLPGACDSNGSVITCEADGPIASGGTLALGAIIGQVTAAGNSTVSSNSSVQVKPSAPAKDPNADNNLKVANITVTPGSDLSITKSRSVAGTLLVGQSFAFTLTPRYSGDSPSSITVTDTIPSNYTIGTVLASQNGWSCSVAGQAVTCTRPSGGVAGANQSLGTISIPVTAAVAGTGITNTANIGSATSDPNMANNSANDGGANIVAPTVDLGVSKTGPNPALVVQGGDPFEYRITANNSGTTGYYGEVTVTDNLPTGLMLNSYQELNGWACTPAAPVAGPVNIACKRTYTSGSPLAPNATTPAVVLRVTATTTGTINNTVTIAADCNLGAGNCGDGDMDNYQITSSVSTSSADIRVLKSVVGPNPVPAGDVLTYRLEIVNDGPVTSNDVVLADTLGNLINSLVDDGNAATLEGYVGHNLSAGVATGGSCSTATQDGLTGRRLTCNFNSVPVCAAGSDCPVITVQVRPGGNGGNRSNTASVVSTSTADPDHVNDEVTVTSVVEARADVTVSKNANPGTVNAGQPLTYLITATNIANGLSAAQNVTVTDTLPVDVTFVSATPSAGTCSVTPGAGVTTTSGNRTLTCNLGSLDNGSQRTVSVIVRPNNATRGTTIQNVVDVSTTTTETNLANNQASIGASVIAPNLDLVINKVDTIDPVAVGDNTAYTLTITNSGPSAAENVVVNDDLPVTGQLSFQSVSTSSGSCPTQPTVDALGGLVSCELGYLPPGSTRTVTITMKGVAKGVYDNTAVLTSTEIAGGFDTIVQNNSDGETTTVRTKADMEVVSKTPSLAIVNVRDNFNFVIRVRNNGPANEADDVTVNDLLPANMVLTGAPSITTISGSNTLNTCTGTAGGTGFSCSLGTVSNGGIMEITVPVEIAAVTTLPQTFTNTATITTTSLDINAGNNSNSGNVSVNSSSIAGRVFSDINNDGLVSAGDVGLAEITMTLTGTTFDGIAVNRTVDTDASGNYIFTGVPQGTYQISEGVVTAKHFVDGIDTAGSVGGNISVNDRISSIALPANTSATGYNFAEVPVPLIGIAKSAGGVVNNSDGTYNVEFTLNVENAGKTALSSVQITDDIAPEFGNYVAGTPAAGQYTVVSGPSVSVQTNGAMLVPVAAGVFTGSGAGNRLLDPASSALPNYGTGTKSTAIIRFTIRFFPTTPGPFENTATVTAVSPTNTPVTDNSVSGAIPDADLDDDPRDDTSPTVVSLDGQEIGVTKMVGHVAQPYVVQTGTRRYRIPYSIVVSNLKSTTATNVQVSDDLNTAFQTAQTKVITGAAAVSDCNGTVLNVATPAFNGTTQTNLLAGNQNLQGNEECTITFTVEVDFGSNPLPSVVQTNQAIATTAQSPGGTVIDDAQSDAGVSFTTAALAAVSGKVYLDRNHDRLDNDGSAAPNVGGFIVRVFNRQGNQVGEAVTAADGTYTVTGLYPSNSADPNTFYRLHFVEPVSGAIYGLSQSEDPTSARNGDVINGEITNLELAAGITTLNQNLPLDPSGVVYDSITRAPVSGASVTLLHSGAPVPPQCLVGGMSTQVTGSSGFYQFLFINPAPVGCPGTSLAAETYTLQVVQPGGYLPPASTIIPPTAGPHVPGTGGVAAIQAQAVPPTGAQSTTYYFSFSLTLTGNPATSSSNVVNNHIPLDPILGGAIVMTKSSPLVNVSRGDLVPYTITATNTLAATLTNINVNDRIPAGFRYRKGSASYNGVPIEPTINGRELTWPNQTFTGNERKTWKLLLVVGTGVGEGEYTNQAWSMNSLAGAQVSNLATATVRVVPDPTFDCSDIIGKVFDDQNANGYQDDGEPGIANVRVATARGLLVTTDAEGRFHVACAAIPQADRGSNFVMKLDERTLPTGYRITTENPRDVRVTRGKMVKLNFGATIHKVVRLELSGQAFEKDSIQLSAAWMKQLEGLPDKLKDRPSILRIAYRVADEGADLAKARVENVADKVKELWQAAAKERSGKEEVRNPLVVEIEVEGAK